MHEVLYLLSASDDLLAYLVWINRERAAWCMAQSLKPIDRSDNVVPSLLLPFRSLIWITHPRAVQIAESSPHLSAETLAPIFPDG